MEIDIPRLMDVTGECFLYDNSWIRVCFASGKTKEDLTFRFLLFDLKMEGFGEVADWVTTMALVLISLSSTTILKNH
ncbi:MAG: hypothetical protein AB2L18_08595 [Anaerolineaceae bacterium]